jgi:pantothenate synthetase
MSAMLRSKSSLVLHRTVESIRSFRKALDPSIKVGFVPTMGALHDGTHVAGAAVITTY